MINDGFDITLNHLRRSKNMSAPTFQEWVSGRTSWDTSLEDAWNARNFELKKLNDYIAELEAAITKTLDENGHLADGENCTLFELKQALKNKHF